MLTIYVTYSTASGGGGQGSVTMVGDDGCVVRRCRWGDGVWSLRRTCGETVRFSWAPAVEPYGFTLSGESRWESGAFPGAWRGQRRAVGSLANIPTRPSCGFAKRRSVGREAHVIRSARAHLGARDRGVFRQVLAKTCGNSGRSPAKAQTARASVMLLRSAFLWQPASFSLA